MKLSTMMVIKSVSALFVAAMMLLLPGQVLNLAGVADSPGAGLYARLYGASVVGIMVLTWVARKTGDSPARQAIVLNLFIYDAIAFIVMLVFILTGMVNLVGWIPAALYLFFAVGFGYFLLPHKR